MGVLLIIALIAVMGMVVFAVVRGLHAFAFNPIPANFTDPGTIAQLQETFIFWRVAKGGIGLPNEGFPWASVMPPWEQHLTVDEIWKVILFEYWHTGYYPRTWD